MKKGGWSGKAEGGVKRTVEDKVEGGGVELSSRSQRRLSVRRPPERHLQLILVGTGASPKMHSPSVHASRKVGG